MPGPKRKEPETRVTRIRRISPVRLSETEQERLDQKLAEYREQNPHKGYSDWLREGLGIADELYVQRTHKRGKVTREK